MSQFTKVIARKIPSSPDGKSAVALLRDIASQPVNCSARPVDKPLAIYGAGALGKLAKAYFDRLSIPVSFVVDAQAEQYRADTFWCGVRVLSLDEVAAEDKDAVMLAICVGKVPFTEVTTPLLRAGWSDVVPFYTITAAYLDRHPLGNGWFAGELSRTDIEGIESVLLRYDDNQSRAHHLQFLAWHRLHEEWFFDDAPVTIDDRYFIPEIVPTLRRDEVFVDLGAHHGNVSEKFLNLVDQEFKELWCIEPDSENLARLLELLDGYPPTTREHIHVLPKAVGRNNEVRPFFDGLDFASQICAFGDSNVEVMTLDSLGIQPSFIKAHLEGAEMDAVLGGLQTIRTYRPIVTLSVYHNRLGLWACPKALMDAFEDYGYRFKFRLHSWHGTGAVLYLLNR